MITVSMNPIWGGQLDELKSEANKYTDDAIAKLPTSAIRHMQTGYITVDNSGNTSRGVGTFVALSGFTDKDKMIVIFTPTLSVPRNEKAECLYTGGATQVATGSGYQQAASFAQPFYPYINIIDNTQIRIYMSTGICIDGHYNAVNSFNYGIRIDGTYKVIEFY